MREVGRQVARWLGLFSTGLLASDDEERALRRAERVLGTERLVDLRKWFEAQPPETTEAAKAAVVAACISIVLADSKIDEGERELLERIVQLSELPDAAQETLLAKLEAPPSLDAVIPMISHPALRELVLVIAWELALADGKADASERGAWGVLAKRLSIEPKRAEELRGLFGQE